MIRKLVALALGAAIIGLAGCNANLVKREVEKSVAKSLPELIGPADSYSVRAYGPTLRMMKGKLDGLDIVGKNVRVPGEAVLSTLYVKIRDIHIDTDTKKIKSVKSTEYSASISDKEITRCLIKRYPDIYGLKVEMRKGKMRIAARPGVSIIKAGIQADADLIVKNKRALALNLQTLKVIGVNTPYFARDFVGSRLNTVFDVKELGFDAKIQSAVMTPGFLTLNGDLDLIELTRQK